MDDDDPEIQLRKIVFMLETLVCRYQNVAAALGLGNELGIRQCAPLCFGHGQDFVIGESLPQAGIDTLI